MIKAYINYPDAHVTIHRSPNCSHAKVGPEDNQRHLLVNADTLSKELNKFRKNKYQFAAEAGRRDLWLILDFLDPLFEEAVAGHIKRLVGLHYRPLADCELRVHC